MPPPRDAEGPRIPGAPRSIERGTSLRLLLDRDAIDCLSHNIGLVHPEFDGAGFRARALRGIGPLGLMPRGLHLARALRAHLPPMYRNALEILLRSLTPPLATTQDNGLAVFFYLPHVAFVGEYGLDPEHNGGDDPFEASMAAQYELTQRFSAEFSMRHFLLKWPERCLSRLAEWATDPSPHVRRLASEGSRPRLPWARRLPFLVADPSPTLPILELLKDDPILYVRRSVANHLGDIAKDHRALVVRLCERWLEGASDGRRWVIRHALRYPARMKDRAALRLRMLAS